jgi:hypothetical protein
MFGTLSLYVLPASTGRLPLRRAHDAGVPVSPSCHDPLVAEVLKGTADTMAAKEATASKAS